MDHDDPFEPLGVIPAGQETEAAASPGEPSADSVPGEAATGFLRFTAGGLCFAVEIGRVKEILGPRQVTPVPRTPHWIRGIISHRGAIISLLDLCGRLGLDHRSAAGFGRIVVVRSGGGVAGLLVDGVRGVVSLLLSSIEPPGEGGGRDFVAGTTRQGGEELLLLNLEKVLDLEWNSTAA